MDISIKQEDISKLRPSEYNPRILKPVEARKLKESIQKFGMIDPIICNSRGDRKGIIIGGHQRYEVAKQMGFKTLPVVWLDLDLEKEQELNLRLNRYYGEFDIEKLAEYDYKLLKEVGFKDKELTKITELMEENKNPEIEFTSELMEEHNYVLFYTDNQLDWQVIKEFFGVKPVQALDSREGYERVGVGRVLGGKKLIELIRKCEK